MSKGGDLHGRSDAAFDLKHTVATPELRFAGADSFA
jgi:hypothetical protein